MALDLDQELTAAEREYFATGDATGVLAEQQGGRRRVSPEPGDGLPEFSDAEQRYFDTGGDVTEELRQQYGDAPPPIEDQFDKLRPELRAMLERAVGDHHALKRELQQERVQHGRLQERFDMVTDAVADVGMSDFERHTRHLERQLQEQAPRQIVPGIRDPGEDIIGWAQDTAAQQHEQDVLGRYRATLDDAIRQAPEIYQAYQFAMASRALELMGHRYPDVPIEQLQRSRVDPDIKRAIELEERNDFVDSPDPITTIIRHAQARGWRSPQQIKWAQDVQAEQERRQKAQRDAEQRKQEDIALKERTSFAKHKACMTDNELFAYNTSSRSRAHRDWYYNHLPGPAPHLPRSFFHG
jgi:hypothetical protein